MATLQFDAISIQNRIIASLQAKTSWAQILPDSTNMRLITAISEEMATLARFDAYLTTENKWRLAQNRSSLVYESDILGYTPKRKIAAVGTVRFSTNKNAINTAVTLYDPTYSYLVSSQVAYNGNIYQCILAATGQQPDTSPTYWTRVSGLTYTNAIVFQPYNTTFSDGITTNVCTVSTFTLNTTNDYVDIGVVQGTPKSVSFYAQGINNETFTIYDDSVAEGYIVVTKNGVTQILTPDLRLNTSTDTVYQIINLPDYSGIQIQFGDGVFGVKTISNDAIVVKYIQTLGISGNITSAGIINTVVSTITDSASLTVTGYCMNEDVIGGGKDIEDIETIRANGPLTFQTGGRATSSADYKTILQSFAYVSRAIAWGEYEYNLDNNLPVDTYVPVEENVVHVCAFTTAGVALSTAQQSEVQTYLNSYKAPTDIIKFESPEFVHLIFNVNAKVSDKSFPLTTVQGNVISGLSTTYNINNMQFNQSIYESDYKAYIDSISGVDHHSTTIQMYNLYSFDTGYTLSWTFSLYPVTPSSVSIYISYNGGAYELAAKDDGTGGFAGVGTYNAAGSTISYAYGSALLTITGSSLTGLFTDYTVKVLYSIDNLDLQLTKRSQIFTYDSANVVCTYMN